MTVIDVHTHMIPREWLDLLQREGGDYELKPTRASQQELVSMIVGAEPSPEMAASQPAARTTTIHYGGR